MPEPEPEQSRRRRRRAVGPPGAVRVEGEPLPPREQAEPPADDEHLRAERPPHHDRGV